MELKKDVSNAFRSVHPQHPDLKSQLLACATQLQVYNLDAYSNKMGTELNRCKAIQIIPS